MISPSNRYVTVASPMCGCGRTSMPVPIRNSAGPIWSKKMNGPTICFSRRRQGTAHLETAEVAGARHDDLLDGLAGACIAGLGSLDGCQLIGAFSGTRYSSHHGMIQL